MSENQKSVPYEEMPKQNKEMIRQFASSTAENILKMNREQRESMTKICHDSLEPELRAISAEEFGCDSYEEFLYRIALAAAAVDKKFSFSEKRAVEEIKDFLGLVTDTNAKAFVKENIADGQNKLDLVKVSSLLKPPSRGMFLTFTALIFMGDSKVSDEEYEVMLHILAP